MAQTVEKARLRSLAKFDVNQAAAEFCSLPSDQAAAAAEELGAQFFADMASRLVSDDAAALMRCLPDGVREKILSRSSPETAADLRELLSYPPETAGALMAKEYLAVPVGSTVGGAVEYLREIPERRRGKISYIYVVDDERRLEGVIQVRDLIFYAPATPVREILKGPVVQVETGMSQSDVVALLQRHNYLGLPVVDASQRLSGVISADSALQVLEDEATDDIAKIIGTNPDEMKVRSVRKILLMRIPWLLFNIASGLICAFISGVFQNDISTVAVLFLFVPVVLGLSESTGVQGATIVVRNIALGHISFRDLSFLFYKEMLVGMLVGIVCGVVVGSAAVLWQGSGRLGLALALSMFLAIGISALLGLTLPILFKRIKIDPAAASGPLVLALCDIQTLLVYFNLSAVILTRMAI
ncbi:MAG TPA: magnesium transporter [bacterium]|nr:magnesium transporter [bacterium]